MGLLQPKGPNPHETDVNSPRYTEANKAFKRATEMGISGDAATLIGRGFERVFIQSDMEFKTEAGDFAYIGNRVGIVSDVTKNITTGKVETITVVEDLGALPLDWRATPAEFGYDDNGPGSTTKTTTYAIDPSVAAEVINGGGALLTTGTILICRKRTADKTTWTPEAQAAALFQAKFESGPTVPQPLSITISPETIEAIPNMFVQFSAAILPAEASQDFIWEVQYIEIVPQTITINQNGYVTVPFDAPIGTTVNIIVKSQVNETIYASAVLTVV